MPAEYESVQESMKLHMLFSSRAGVTARKTNIKPGLSIQWTEMSLHSSVFICVY